jgi:NADH-quinone oxidoreductase subunit E
MVNWQFFDNQTPSSARDLVDALRAGQPPAPPRGAPPCTFRETERLLAGRAQQIADGATAGAATLAGLDTAREKGMAAHGLEGEN